MVGKAEAGDVLQHKEGRADEMGGDERKESTVKVAELDLGSRRDMTTARVVRIGRRWARRGRCHANLARERWQRLLRDIHPVEISRVRTVRFILIHNPSLSFSFLVLPPQPLEPFPPRLPFRLDPSIQHHLSSLTLLRLLVFLVARCESRRRRAVVGWDTPVVAVRHERLVVKRRRIHDVLARWANRASQLGTHRTLDVLADVGMSHQELLGVDASSA